MSVPSFSRYDFPFPKDRIAQTPASPRDGARLLVFNRVSGSVSFDVFRNIGNYLPEGSVLVLNQTKVLPARLTVRKETGGVVRLLYLRNEAKCIIALADRRLSPGSRLFLSSRRFFIVLGKEGETYVLSPSFPISDFRKILNRFGETPLPPYIKHSPLSGRKLRNAYQSVFARSDGSVAAPTASLHFTDRLLKKLKRSGIDLQYITLHVGLGTFAPVRDEQLRLGKLHREHFTIDQRTADFLNRAKRSGRPIVAVGTTVVRTLESAVCGKKRLSRLSGETELFIREGHHFSFVDSMVTNFHVPRSSLLMLVSAFAGRKEILSLYRQAILEDFHLFSFGDGMLLL